MAERASAEVRGARSPLRHGDFNDIVGALEAPMISFRLGGFGCAAFLALVTGCAKQELGNLDGSPGTGTADSGTTPQDEAGGDAFVLFDDASDPTSADTGGPGVNPGMDDAGPATPDDTGSGAAPDITIDPVDTGADPFDSGVRPPRDSGVSPRDSGVHVRDSGGTPAACGTLATCGACTPAAGCGWCADTNRCVAGTAAGPTSGRCGVWDYIPSQCPGGGPPADPCAAHATCSPCATDPACGWCASSNACMSGTSAGPSGGSCAAAAWTWRASACPAAPPPDPCAAHRSCLTCTNDNACGYCVNTHGCHTGGASGPADGSCSGLNWAYTLLDCP